MKETQASTQTGDAKIKSLSADSLGTQQKNMFLAVFLAFLDIEKRLKQSCKH